MNNDSTLYVGLDVHKESITVAYAVDTGEVELMGRIGMTPTDIDRLCKRLQSKARHVRVVYEAGPCGYGLYRRLTKQCFDCMVCAPSLIPRKPGERMKTDRRDSIKLVRSLRAEMLVIEAFEKVAADLPFAMLGLDSDNDTAFMNQSVFDYCKGHGLEQTRSRAYKKNDQAWVEQKNGSVVRRLVGYGRLSGTDARNALAQLYASSRLYINFFQPSFKLKSKTRDGARVHKVYLAPATPCDRLLAHDSVEPAIKEKLKAQFNSLDPVRLLQEMRTAQQTLSEFAAHGVRAEAAPAGESDVVVFLASLSSAWKEGEARPTHRKQPKAKHWWKTRVDPFADVWPVVEGWLIADPTVAVNELMDRLAKMVPDAYASKTQLRTLHRRVKAWRAERVREMVLGSLRQCAETPTEV